MAKKKAKIQETKEDILAKAKKMIERGKALKDNDIVTMGLDLLESVGGILEEVKTQNPFFKTTKKKKSLGKKDRPPRVEQLQPGSFTNNWNPNEYEKDSSDTTFDKAVVARSKKTPRNREAYEPTIHTCEKCGDDFQTFQGSLEYMCQGCIGG